MLVSRVKMVRFKTEMTQFRTCRRGERGKRRGLGPRNDVLTTCKMVTLRGGKRIVFPTVNILIEARSEPEEEKINKWKKLNHASVFFLAYRICLLVLKSRGKLKRNRVRS